MKSKYPLSNKQIISFKESTKRINLWIGSVRSGKSYITLLRFLQEIKDGPDGEYIIVGKSERTVLHNVIQPMQTLLGGIIRYNRGLGEFTLFDRKVYVVGANDERAEGKIRGSTFAGALVDEVSIIPHSFFSMLLSRLSVAGAKLFGTSNPDSPFHWLKTDIIDNPKVTDKSVFQFELEDNPALSEDFVNNLKAEYKGLWYKRFIEGQWVLAEGAIYDFFDTSLHTYKNQPPTYAKYYLLGIDYGTSNPFAAVLVGFNDDHHPAIWVEKEYYWDSKKMECQKTDIEYAQDLQKNFAGYPIKLVYLDPSAASFQVELQRARFPVVQANNDVIDGIRTVAKYLSAGDLIIGSQCTNLIKEMQGYVWDIRAARDGIDRPLKQRDHACDALRYAIHSHFGTRQTLKETNQKQSYEAMEQAKYAANPMAYPGFTDSFGWQRF